MRRTRHDPILPSAQDNPFGPPPEEYRYRCLVCRAEMLVNEASMDGAIGAAKFRGDISVGCPSLGIQDATARRWSMLIKLLRMTGHPVYCGCDGSHMRWEESISPA